MRIHNVFHTNFLKKTSEDPLSGQVNKPSSSVVIDNEEEWEVKEIFDARKHYSRIQFKVKWVGHDENRNWYNSEKFDYAIDIVKNFYEQHSNKSKSEGLLD